MTSVNNFHPQIYIEPLSIYFKIPEKIYNLIEYDDDTIERVLDKLLRFN